MSDLAARDAGPDIRHASQGVPRWFARNRRDGARLLSSALIVMVVGLVRWDHPIGRVVGSGAAAVSLYWWLQYRRLSR